MRIPSREITDLERSKVAGSVSRGCRVKFFLRLLNPIVEAAIDSLCLLVIFVHQHTVLALIDQASDLPSLWSSSFFCLRSGLEFWHRTSKLFSPTQEYLSTIIPLNTYRTGSLDRLLYGESGMLILYTRLFILNFCSDPITSCDYR